MTLLKPLLICCDQYYRRKRLCGITFEATIEAIVEKDNPCSGLKNIMMVQKQH